MGYICLGVGGVYILNALCLLLIVRVQARMLEGIGSPGETELLFESFYAWVVRSAPLLAGAGALAVLVGVTMLTGRRVALWLSAGISCAALIALVPHYTDGVRQFMGLFLEVLTRPELGDTVPPQMLRITLVISRAATATPAVLFTGTGLFLLVAAALYGRDRRHNDAPNRSPRGSR